jgi:Flp pilus assembly protein TadD
MKRFFIVCSLLAAGIYCQKVLAQEPATVQHVQRGEHFASRGQLALAVREYEQALDAGAGSAQVLNRLAEFYLQTGAPDKAVAVLQRSLQEKPGQLQVYSRLGEAFYSQGRPDSAIHYVEEARRLAPQVSEVRSSLGFLYLQTGDRGRAREHLEVAVGLDPGNPEAHRYLGVFFIQTDSLDQALQQFRRLVELLPDDVEALNNVAFVLSRQQHYRQAIECYTRAKALAVDPRVSHAISLNIEAANAILAGKMRARYILVDTQAEAREVQQRLQQGGDFAELASQYSKAANAADGGDTGFFGPGELLPEFEGAVTRLRVGSVSEVVEVPHGVLVIQRVN